MTSFKIGQNVNAKTKVEFAASLLSNLVYKLL